MSAATGPIEAIVFDFDGLLMDIESTITQAREAGLRCAVASRSPESWVTGLPGRTSLLALRRLGLAPQHAVAGEDTPQPTDTAPAHA
jgi:beta-phosphoglucomutase-like phosphatase (HAD superfamily)